MDPLAMPITPMTTALTPANIPLNMGKMMVNMKNAVPNPQNARIRVNDKEKVFFTSIAAKPQRRERIR